MLHLLWTRLREGAYIMLIQLRDLSVSEKRDPVSV